MHSFELFVKSLQSAIVNSTDYISSRNKQILDEYFEREVREVILENTNYNKELFSILQPIKNSELYSDFSKKDLLDYSLKTIQDPQLNPEILSESEKNINTGINEDTLLAKFLTYSYKQSASFFVHSSKAQKEKNFLYILSSNVGAFSLEDKHKSLSDKYFYNSTYYDSIIEEDNKNLNINIELKNKREECSKIEEEVSLLQNSIDNEQNKKNEITNELLRLEGNSDNNNKSVIDVLKSDLDKLIVLISTNISTLDVLHQNVNQLKKELNSLVEIQSTLSKLIEVKKKEYADYLNNIYHIIVSSFNFVSLSSLFKEIKQPERFDYKAKKYIDEIINLIKSSKRYIKKTIESLVPKTVRVNYPSTYEYATPDNDKEFKTITTPVEVPLITLVPISNYNIEKATFTANFKFDVIEDNVMIDFSKNTINEGEQINNHGKVEITLSPQQTPEGLKSLIESYENFLKRQIV